MGCERQVTVTETAQQYIARILSNVDGQDAWHVLQTTPERLRASAATLTPSQIDRPLDPGKWSIRQILAHLADAEVVASWRLRAILAQDGVTLQPFDQNTWASVFRYEKVDVEESLAVFSVLRRANLRLLKSVDPARHAHAGRHLERGEERIDHLIRLYAGHDINHLKQIEQLAVL
jgi:hypothetical protein